FHVRIGQELLFLTFKNLKSHKGGTQISRCTENIIRFCAIPVRDPFARSPTHNSDRNDEPGDGGTGVATHQINVVILTRRAYALVQGLLTHHGKSTSQA